jgi:hypothetical protein
MKSHTVRVSNELAGRVDEVQDKLRRLGVKVSVLYATASVPRTPQGYTRHTISSVSSGTTRRKCRSAHSVLHVLGHAYLTFCIIEKAIGYWPQIKKILVDAGLTRDQITTLGLSQAMRQPKSRKKSKTRVR